MDLDATAVRELGRAAVEIVANYYQSLPSIPIMPATNGEAVRDLFAEPLPDLPCNPEELLKLVRERIFALSRHNGHPRFFGYVASPGTAISAFGDLLASTLNANVTSWRSGPAPAEIERLTVDWMKQAIGYPATAGGLFVSGGSMANFSAIVAARHHKAPGAARGGMHTVRKPLRVYVSEETHFSIQKAAGMAGIGEENVVHILTDAALRMDTNDLRKRIEHDIDNGFEPMCVAASAGTVSTGAFDPIGEIAEIARRYGIWLHVDAAYGGFAALAPSAKHLFRDIAHADSVTLDPHKWLYTSMGCGCILYRDPETARAAFSHDAAYTQPIGLEDREAFAFWDYGPELSRRFRALNVWLQLKCFGTAMLGEAIEENIQCARYFEELVSESADFEMLAPVELSIFCFRYSPPAYSADLDELNERILVKVQRSGGSYVSNARVRGRFALRGCVLNYRTTKADMRTLLDDVRRAAQEIQ